MLLGRIYWTAFLAWHARGQGRYPFAPIETVRRDQARRVQAMVAYAHQHVPYYRETLRRLGLTPADFRTADDLARLPLLSRDVLQRDPERLCSDAIPRGKCLQMRTSGSTGAPCMVAHDPRAAFLSAAHVERERAVLAPFLGRRTRYRELMIAPIGNSTREGREFCHEHAWVPDALRVRRRYLSIYEPPERAAAALNEFQPDLLYSYGSYLGMLFGHLREAGVPFHRPKAIVYSSDAIPSATRRYLLDDLRIPLFSLYQALEAWKVGFECEQHRGHHVNADWYPLRIAGPDGRSLPPGEVGDVVVSNLVNRATVLLNYRLGDAACLVPEPCPCGRSLPLLSFVQGRSDDLLTLPSGEVVHPLTIHDIMAVEPLVWQYQAVQRTPSHFELAVVVAGGCDRARLTEHLTARFVERFGAGVTLDVSYHDAIERTPGGKHRIVRSLVPPPRGETPP